jgi:hypothetical protein
VRESSTNFVWLASHSAPLVAWQPMTWLSKNFTLTVPTWSSHVVALPVRERTFLDAMYTRSAAGADPNTPRLVGGLT